MAVIGFPLQSPSHGLNQCSALGSGQLTTSLSLDGFSQNLCKYCVTHGNAIPAVQQGVAMNQVLRSCKYFNYSSCVEETT